MTRKARNEKTIPNQELVLEAARKLRDSGLSYEKIARKLQAGVSAEWFKFRLEPGYADRKREEWRNQSSSLNHTRMSKAFREPRPITDDELRRRREAEPEDDRDFTARFMGDPPYHRSALAQRERRA